VPAYNAERWIAETLASATGQTWTRTEVIVVDDGSRDATLEVARRFESGRLKLLSQENQGAAAARNKAYSLCQGDYIQWLDADDLLHPEKVARQIACAPEIDSGGTLLSGSWGRFLHRPHRAEFVPTGLWEDLSPAEWLLRKLEENVYMQTATWLVPRDTTERAGPWDTQLLGDDDGEYFNRVLLQSRQVRFVREAKVFYRISGTTSLSYIGRSDRKMNAQLRSMKLTVDYLRGLDDSPRARAACLTYMQNWLTSFYPQRPDIVAELEAIARELGGNLTEPKFSWRYAWIARLFGPSVGRRAQVALPALRWSAKSALDRTALALEQARSLLRFSTKSTSGTTTAY